MRLSVDTNVLIYAFETDDRRTDIARRIIESIPFVDSVLTLQVIGEFLNVVLRKHRGRLADALDAVSAWSVLCPSVTTATEHLVDAADLAYRHKLQFWDSLILTVAKAAAVDVLLTEDLQNAATIGGVRIMNPFDPRNEPALAALAALLTPSPGTA